MKILELGPDRDFSHAAELPVKGARWINGTQKSSPSGNSGGVKPARIVPNAARGVFAEQQKADRKITEQHQRILVLHHGKARLMTRKEFEVLPA